MATEKKKKVCASCEKPRVLTVFYSTNSKMFKDKKVPICKDCLVKQIDVKDVRTVKSILRQIDKPFLATVWETATNSGKDIFGEYMRIVNSLPQYKKLTYEDSTEDIGIKPSVEHVDDDLIDEITMEDSNQVIKVDNNLKIKYGTGYKNEEYLKMEKFYQEMISSYDISTPQHVSMLIEICKVDVQKDKALRSGIINDYKNLASVHKDLLKDAGFRPVDRVSSNESAGIRTFSQVFAEIEKDGFIEPAPIQVDKEIIDRTILYVNNYTRKLLNMDVLQENDDEVGAEVFLEGEDYEYDE